MSNQQPCVFYGEAPVEAFHVKQVPSRCAAFTVRDRTPFRGTDDSAPVAAT